MRQEFKLQDPGEGVHEVEINEVLVSEGDEVAEGDDVLVVESDKAAVELPSPYTGRIAELRVAVGDVVKVGDVLMVVETEAAGEADEGAGDGDESATGEAEGNEKTRHEKAEKTSDGEDGETSGEKDKSGDQAGERREAEAETASDQRARDSRDGKEPRAEDGEEAGHREAAGEGPEADEDEPEAGSRRREPDAEADPGNDEEDAEKPKKEGEARRKSSAAARRETAEGPVRAAPAARKLARDEGLDLAGIEPTGDKGQVILEDVRAALEDGQAAEDDRRPAETTGKAEAAEDRDDFGPVERRKLKSIRAATGRAMARSWREIPHVTHEDLADITELERWRRKAVRDEGLEELTLTPIVTKAVVAALRRHPGFNARMDADADEMVLCRYYNVNFAVATERGLITPVIRDVDAKPLRAVAREMAEMAERMRSGRPGKQDLEGGTFTITNVGAIGGTSFAPLINPPQSAILGLGRARLAQVVRGDLDDLDNARTEIRLLLPLVVAFDHRLLDGADAAAFVAELADLLGDPERLVLDI